MALPDDEVHLWFSASDGAAADVAAHHTILSGSERARAERLMFARDRDAFIAAHAFVRRVLSHYAGVAPAEWTFATNEHGRPRVAAPSFGDLDFNLSHTDGLAVCIVGRGMIGVDVEDLARPAPLEIAPRFFAPLEAATLARQPATHQARRFYELWTLKEAYVKACGVGLRLPLDGFAFDLDAEAAPRVSFVPPSDGEAARWSFALRQPTARHLVAIALRDAPAGLRIVTRELRRQ